MGTGWVSKGLKYARDEAIESGARDVSGYLFLRGRVPAHLEAIFNTRQHYLDRKAGCRAGNAINKFNRRSDSLFTC